MLPVVSPLSPGVAESTSPGRQAAVVSSKLTYTVQQGGEELNYSSAFGFSNN